jgi:hypothetical protein
MKKQYRFWTNKEIEYLQDNWGTKGYKQIAKKLGRTTEAVMLKSHKLGLSGIMSVSDYLILNQISQILKISCPKIKKWAKIGLKLNKRQLTLKRYMWFVTHEDLMEFLENNPKLWNATKVEEYSLGYEPDWLINKRRSDKYVPLRRKTWTYEEDKELEKMYYIRQMDYKEIAKELNRTYMSVKRRMTRLSNLRLKRVV